MLGKISTGVRSAEMVPEIRIRTARTTNVYGRCNAIRTMAIIDNPYSAWAFNSRER
jgi:hypothetical protein